MFASFHIQLISLFSFSEAIVFHNRVHCYFSHQRMISNTS